MPRLGLKSFLRADKSAPPPNLQQQWSYMEDGTFLCQQLAMWLFLIDPSWSALRELYLSDTAPYWTRNLQDRFSLANFDSTSQGGDEGM